VKANKALKMNEASRKVKKTGARMCLNVRAPWRTRLFH
jgi:hypothetical protein